MKNTVMFLAISLFATHYSFSQTGKTDATTLRDARLASTKYPASLVGINAIKPAKMRGPLAKTESGSVTSSMSPAYMPAKTHAKPQHAGQQTQTLHVGTKMLQANTRALIANTQALLANTRALTANTQALAAYRHALAANSQALQANLIAGGSNARFRVSQEQPAQKLVNAPLKTKMFQENERAKKSEMASLDLNTFSANMSAKLQALFSGTVAKIHTPAKTQTLSANKTFNIPFKPPVPRMITPTNAPAKPEALAANLTTKIPVKPPVPKMVMPPKVPLKPDALSAGMTTKIPVKPPVPKMVTPAKVLSKPDALSAGMTTKIQVKPPVPKMIMPIKALSAGVTPKTPMANRMVRTSSRSELPQPGMRLNPIFSSAGLENSHAKLIQKPEAVTLAKTSQEHQIIPQATAYANWPMKSAISTKGNMHVKLDDLMKLRLASNRYDSKWHNSKLNPIATKSGLREGSIVTTQGYVQLVATDDSGKWNETYSLQLTVRSHSKDSCFIVKIASYEAKDFILEHFTNEEVPCMRGNILQKPVYVSITGELVYDAGHSRIMRGPRPIYRGRKGMHTYTAWRICQVNHIELAAL
jgi:hypothetical protein